MRDLYCNAGCITDRRECIAEFNISSAIYPTFYPTCGLNASRTPLH